MCERRGSMDQEKIGKFIAECRKEKGITQSELAFQLGVTDRAVSNWENGKNMPDLSLFQPLCDILHITINELLSGERLKQDDYEKFEKNVLNTVRYSTKKIHTYKNIVAFLLILFGLFIALSALMIFPSESSWGSIYSILGIVLFMIGLSRMIHVVKWYKKFFLMFLIFIGILGGLLFMDYMNVKMHDEAPMFRIKTVTTGSVIYYDTLFYDVYRCNFDEENEYWVIEKNKEPTIPELIDYCIK